MRLTKKVEDVVKALLVCTSERTLSKCSKQCPYHNNSDCRTRLMIEAADAIEELSREIDIDNAAMTAMDAAMPRWIPVTERLPEINTKALVLCRFSGGKSSPKGEKTWQTVGTYKENKYDKDNRYWALYGGEALFWTPTHWMPLPESPKEET